MENVTVRVQLSFPLALVPKPIIWHMSHDYDLVFSIRRASIDAKSGGFSVLELTGPKARIDSALKWAVAEGVEVTEIGLEGTDE